MNTNLKNNANSLRKSIKKVPEIGRTLAGVATRGIFKPAPFSATPVLFEPRVYRPKSSKRDVQVVTPDDGHYMHTFFDINPISPSGRYLVLTKVPFIWRIPYPGDAAQVCIVDLEKNTCTAVYQTTGWGTQLGANTQWGPTDNIVYCNDVIEGKGVGVEIDINTRKTRILEGPIFGLTPDKKYSYSGDIELINQSQTGYGIPEYIFSKRSAKDSASRDDGIWRTDLQTGKSELFLSVYDIVSPLPEQDDLVSGKYYIYNVKCNPQNSRLLVVLFSKGAKGRLGWPMQLVTCKTDGSDIQLAVPDAIWRKGGHHANWHPNGEDIVMNLKLNGRMQFTKFRFDGTGLDVMAGSRVGGGHPSVHPNGGWLLTDAYASEGLSDASGDVPIRLINIASEAESEICRVHTKKLTGGRRVDPHPVWVDNGGKVVFNSLVEGKRQVLIARTADLT